METVGHKVACVGASITYGQTLGNREEECYPAVLQRLLGSGYEVRNFGRSGAGIWHGGYAPYTITEEYKNAVAYGAEIIIVCLGTNDVIYPTDHHLEDELVSDYKSLLDDLTEHSPENAKVLLAKIPPVPCMFKDDDKPVQVINKAVEITANEFGAELLDFYEPFRTREGLFSDGVHPNKDGAELIAIMVYNRLKEIGAVLE